MTCCQCQFFQAIETPEHLPIRNRYGECRLEPPQVATPDLNGQPRSRAIFPIVRVSDWCGEYRTRHTAPDAPRSIETAAGEVV